MIVAIDLDKKEIELLISQLDNDNCGPRGETWKSVELENLIDKVNCALKCSSDEIITHK